MDILYQGTLAHLACHPLKSIHFCRSACAPCNFGYLMSQFDETLNLPLHPPPTKGNSSHRFPGCLARKPLARKHCHDVTR